jgi:hypothetical protein
MSGLDESLPPQPDVSTAHSSTSEARRKRTLDGRRHEIAISGA